jgi:hypothetical protein
MVNAHPFGCASVTQHGMFCLRRYKSKWINAYSRSFPIPMKLLSLPVWRLSLVANLGDLLMGEGATRSDSGGRLE